MDAGRLINWETVCRVEREGAGVAIHFVDGSRIRDNRTLEEIWEIIQKFWGK